MRGEKMRLLRFLVSYAVVTVLGVILFLFVALNHYTVQLDVFGPEYSVSLALVMAGAVAFGFVIAMLLVLPGRIAAALNAHSLEREVRYLEQDLVELQELRARLLARHDYLVEGHERILLRYHSLLNDHSRVVSERDDAVERLAAAQAPRPIAAAAGQSSAAPLRLLSPAAPAPAARPAEQPPAARISADVASGEPPVERRKAQPEPLLPAPVDVKSGPKRQVPVTSITEVERPPAAAAVPPTPLPTPPPAPPAEEAVPKPQAAPPAPPAAPQRKAEPRTPLLQPALLFQRAQRGLATRRDRAQRGLTTQRDRIQRRITRTRDQMRPRVAALRATVQTQLSQFKRRLTSTSDENSTGGDEQSQMPVARVGSVSHPLGE
jgi:uncharacterized integral membrane protein